MARATVKVWVERKPTVSRWVLVVPPVPRIQVVAVAAIGVVGVLVIHRSLIALAPVAIPVVVAVPVTPRLMY
jgi:hypothetical protein